MTEELGTSIVVGKDAVGHVTVYTNSTVHCTNVVDQNGKQLGGISIMTLSFNGHQNRVTADIDFADGRLPLKSVPVMGIKSFDEYTRAV